MTPGDNYWGLTDAILGSKGAPPCPHCGKTMFPQDDHGRFACFCQGIGKTTVDGITGSVLPVRPIPQIDTTGMTDEERAAIPPFHRLDDPPTAAEAATIKRLFSETNDAMISLVRKHRGRSTKNGTR